MRNNVVQGFHSIYFENRSAQLHRDIPGSRYLVANNLLDAVAAPVLMEYLDSKVSQPPPRTVRIENNIMRSRYGAGVNMVPNEFDQVKSAWRVGHNCYGTEPVELLLPGAWIPFPKGDTDIIAQLGFVSEDPNDANYLRIPQDSPLATAGAGGDLPTYIGPFPPIANFR